MRAFTPTSTSRPIALVAVVASLGLLLFFLGPDTLSSGAPRMSTAAQDCPPPRDPPACPQTVPQAPPVCPPPPPVPVDFTPDAVLSEYKPSGCVSEAPRIDPLLPRMATQAELVKDGECEALMQQLEGEFRLHRKQWEFCVIIRAFQEVPTTGRRKRALVFAVGTEPLPAYFAAQGTKVVATDMPASADAGAVQAWATTNQHSTSLEGLVNERLLDTDTLRQRVTFLPVNMNLLPFGDLPDGKFDFIWSTCAVEHVGSITLGQTFVLNSLRMLRPGGVAVHTVEYSLSSTGPIYTDPHTAAWRRQDVEAVLEAARLMGYAVLHPCYDLGSGELDSAFDRPPYSPDRHMKLLIGNHVCTSYAMIFKAPAAAA